MADKADIFFSYYNALLKRLDDAERELSAYRRSETRKRWASTVLALEDSLREVQEALQAEKENRK